MCTKHWNRWNDKRCTIEHRTLNPDIEQVNSFDPNRWIYSRCDILLISRCRCMSSFLFNTFESKPLWCRCYTCISFFLSTSLSIYFLKIEWHIYISICVSRDKLLWKEDGEKEKRNICIRNSCDNRNKRPSCNNNIKKRTERDKKCMVNWQPKRIVNITTSSPNIEHQNQQLAHNQTRFFTVFWLLISANIQVNTPSVSYSPHL